tara:strand:+ start:625 stop:738 length:114 start_codon:yes stop_codon:yes gene_type:complete
MSVKRLGEEISIFPFILKKKELHLKLLFRHFLNEFKT